ncbi:type VI secretion system Vgr family protein [Piscirickettsia litoralis]|uniref:Gp5/Type VI secretion system Vgr protein OB-fold domain-containing protein n=1 Tax=Piscirickettsia litoralis TaxID=1891921 RepID=A0ABX3A574_9GAMM|nr:hypothetical protein [Piscirickettsia litoralis]ODN41264.1 hypothetical protein BGC07_16970 [Piscirickettsia litoralis]
MHAYIKEQQNCNLDYAELDDQGRYYVKMANYGSRSVYFKARKLEPFSGENYGMHLPLKPNSEVLISFIEGYPESPIIIGSLYNSNRVNVVKDSNAYDHIIRSKSGSEIKFSDKENEPSLQIKHPGFNWNISTKNSETNKCNYSMTSNSSHYKEEKHSGSITTLLNSLTHSSTQHVTGVRNTNTAVGGINNSNTSAVLNFPTDFSGTSLVNSGGLAFLKHEVGTISHTEIGSGYYLGDVSIASSIGSLEIGTKNEISGIVSSFLPSKWTVCADESETNIRKSQTIADLTELVITKTSSLQIDINNTNNRIDNITNKISNNAQETRRGLHIINNCLQKSDKATVDLNTAAMHIIR